MRDEGVFLPKPPGLPRILPVLFLFLCSCAQILPPEGGPRDETAPLIREDASTPDRQTSVRPVLIRLQFDEWVQLKDPQKQVVISPPTRTPPLVKARGKAVEVSFDPAEPWKDSTTYTLFFGNAVVDRTEGNPVRDLKRVFSTGPVVDSLSATGKVVDARTRRPVEEVLVILHRDMGDSAITNNLPDYFTRTGKEGAFRLTNLRAGTYRAYVLVDRNANYRYDLADEQLGSGAEPLSLSDSTATLPMLELSPPLRPLRVISADSSQGNGAVRFAFNRPPRSWTSDAGGGAILQWTADSLLVAWRKPGTPGGMVFVEKDTLRYGPARDTALGFGNAPMLRHTGKLPPNVDLALICSPPLAEVDTSRIEVLKDTLLLPTGTATLAGQGDTLLLGGVSPEASSVIVRFLPGALRNVLGVNNSDTMALGFLTGKADDWSMLQVRIDSIAEGTTLLFELTDAQGKAILPVRSLQGPSAVVSLPPLVPGNYLIFLSADRNGNGRWDGADHYRGLPAEPRSAHTVPALRANWELELELRPSW
jgi:uncharacterized protein (DUF2141 family)